MALAPVCCAYGLAMGYGAVVEVAQILPPGFAGESHLVAVHSGYTYSSPACNDPRTKEAIPASLAARMAFCSFAIRWELR